MKLSRLIFVVIACFCLNVMSAQDLRPGFSLAKDEIMEAHEQRKQRIIDFLNSSGLSIELDLGDGRKAYIVDVINNKPIYMSTDNLEAGQTIGANQLRSGGSLGLNLTGRGLRLLVWDGNEGARASHQEFGDRLEVGSDIGPGSADDHASHVTGTVIAGGVNPDAIGMAPGASAVAYGFNNDVSEMLAELESNSETMILSNHSYGPLAGWTSNNGSWSWNGDEDISATEDWKFGFYSSRARQYDELVYNAPYYLIIKSAGNHRTDSGDGSIPADGPYDIIALQGTAKNIITVGAVQKLNDAYTGPDDVMMSSFSSWGPTDDGRIKPDITAPGVSVRSVGASADDSYLTLQGTSMSTPVVTGGLALIQQLHSELKGSFMKASALKALMIHNAREAGSGDGPDYEYGWGLFNVEGMAKFLLEENGDNKSIIMDALADGESNEYTITPEADTKVTLTLVWTDVPGSPVSTQLDPEDLMLVNDLDMRAAGATETQMPWVLKPNVPQQPAEKEDNFRDNVEKIEFTAVDESYTVTINHKNSISGEGPQEYALVIEYEKAGAGKTVYWVGNSGDWANGDNWSLSSGGSPMGAVPTAKDIVIFDDNSFQGLNEGESYAVSLSADASVSGLRFFAEREGAVDFGGNTLSIGGDLTLLSEQADLNNGFLNMMGLNGNTVINVQSPVSGSEIILNGEDETTFQLTGNIEAKKIELQNGNLTIENKTLTLEDFAMSGGVLQVENAQFTLSNSFNLTAENLDIDWMNSTINVPAGEAATIDLSGASVPMDFTVAGELQLNNAAEVRNITLTQAMTVDSNLTIGDISLAAGSTLTIGDGDKLTVSGSFDASGVDGDLVNVNSNGTGELGLAGHRKVCVDFFSIDGVSYNGESTLSIGTNSELAASEQGWIQQACDDVLFADFTFDYACVNSIVYFNDASSGNIQSWDWLFHDDASSTSQNVLREYSAVGDFDVSLTVDDGSATSEYERSVSVVENDMPENTVRANGNTLISQRGATTYQWFKDDQLLPGENGQTLVTQGEEGVYFVLTFGENCNRISDSFEFTVTSIEPDPEEQDKLEEAINVFPNPTRDFIDVTVEGYTLKTLSMELVDQSGKIVTTSRHDNINSQSFSERLNVSDKRQGFYVLRFVVNENVYVNRKVILTN